METLKETCSICLDVIREDEVSTLSPCRHSFCFPCITGWLEQKSLCPLCMKDAKTVTYTEPKGEKKERIVEVKNEKLKEEEFECLDHGHFIMEYENLLRRAEEVEFNIRSLMNLKKNSSQLDEYTSTLIH